MVKMTYTIAVAGKGGVGKTSVSALIVKYLTGRGKGLVLAVDADPNSNLNEKLGMSGERTIGSIREELTRNIESLPAGVSKAEHIGYQVKCAMSEGRGFDLLAMGRPEGPGCYCYLNNLLRTIIDGLSEKYRYVVIDNEAGMEHLSRRTARKVDLLLVVSDSSHTGIRTARRIGALSREMDLKAGQMVMLVNRAIPGRIPDLRSGKPVGGPDSRPDGQTDGEPFSSVETLPEDGILNAYNSESKSLLGLPVDSAAYNSLEKIMERLVK